MTKSTKIIENVKEEGYPGLAKLFEEIKELTFRGRHPDFDKIEAKISDVNFIESQKQVKLAKFLCQFMYTLGIEKTHRLVNEELRQSENLSMEVKNDGKSKQTD